MAAPRRGPVRRLFLSLLPLALVYGLAEGVARVLGWPEKDPRREFTHGEVYWAERGSQHREAYPHRETGGTFRVSTDANGLRAPLHAEERTPGVTRVMTLGCSTTFGWGVDDEASYPARLESILQTAGHPVQVVNGGQPGHTSFQGLWLWDRVLARYAPDVVVFGYLVQDARSVAYSDSAQAMLQRPGDFVRQSLLHRSQLYLGLVDLWQGLRRPQQDGPAEGGVYRVPPEEYVANLRAFRQRIEAVGAKMVLFGFPLEREGYTARHRSILRAAAAELALPLYDPQPEMERMSAEAPLYFPQDRGHANADGLDRIAQGMAQFLIAERLVPPAAEPPADAAP